MFVYVTTPIDYWEGWTLLDKFLDVHSIDEEDAEPFADVRREAAVNHLMPFLDKAYAAAKERGWDGDFREGPYVSGIPPRRGTFDPTFVLGWKQDRNGTTFVVSPYEMPWLDRK